jgi:pyruvate kinase
MKALIENGMDVARFNFSHGTHEEQKERMDKLKKLRRELKKPTAILLDTKGPEIRTGVLKDGKKVTLEEGQIFTLTTEEIVGDSTRVSQTYADLPRDLNIGDRVLIDDGLIEMTVEQIGARDVVCRVDNGGELGERKGINLPGVKVNLPPITDKDREDIKFGIEQGIDFIAASFVRNAAAINEIRKILKENDAEDIDIIAKVENREGLNNIDEIIDAADGVMVARGDMGVEIPAEEVPYWQRTIISKVNAHYKPVIVATQMLDSMIRNPRPTRAEVSDVSNAVIQSTDAIMLSGETANGRYPVEALKTMSAIAEFTEEHQKYKIPNFSELEGEANVSSAVGVAAVQTSVHVEAKCIVTPTMSGQTPRLLCNFRPSVPIYAVTPNERACRRMQIDWGVTPLMGYQEDSTENIVSHALYVVKREKKVKPGDMVVVTAGDPATNKVRGKGNMTNMMYVVQAF